MSKLQQSIFLNLSRQSSYQSKSRCLSSSTYNYFAKNREEEIENQFEFVDFQGTKKISKHELIDHLTQKHGELDMDKLNNVFSTMNWDYKGEVSKDQFCTKYLAREKELYREANRLFSLRQKVETILEIFNETKKTKPPLYAIINIEKVFIKSERPQATQEDMLSLEIEYEDHEHKLQYLIEQPVYRADDPSFKLLLPAQENYFFVKYKFIDPKSKVKDFFGQCYVSFPIADALESNKSGPTNIEKAKSRKVDVTKNNEVKGYCQFTIVFESDVFLSTYR